MIASCWQFTMSLDIKNEDDISGDLSGSMGKTEQLSSGHFKHSFISFSGPSVHESLTGERHDDDVKEETGRWGPGTGDHPEKLGIILVPVQ